MNGTADIKVGQVVISKAGRDKEQFFVVLEVIDDRYLLLAAVSYTHLTLPTILLV